MKFIGLIQSIRNSYGEEGMQSKLRHLGGESDPANQGEKQKELEIMPGVQPALLG